MPSLLGTSLIDQITSNLAGLDAIRIAQNLIRKSSSYQIRS